MRGYFGVGVECMKNEVNYGTLYRTAYILGASFLFLIGKRFQQQASDTPKSWQHIPLFKYSEFHEFYQNLPHDCMLIGIELDDRATPLERFCHPRRACYLLGAEDHGLKADTARRCHRLVKLRGEISMNVSVAGSIVLHHRVCQLAPLLNGTAAKHRITSPCRSLTHIPCGTSA
jgi:tRNA G18 (ribose-2'-O)-methylase SpoU